VVVILRKNILSVILKLALLVILSACDGDFSWCLTSDPQAYTTDNIAQSINTTVKLNANGVPDNVSTASSSVKYGQWVSSNVTVAKGDNITISAKGNIIVAPAYGLQPKYNVNPSSPGLSQDQLSAFNSMTDGKFITTSGQLTSSGVGYFDNSGLGTKMVVMANNNTLTTAYTINSSGSLKLNSSGNPIPFPFVKNQNLLVTVSDCQTGDQSSSSPTKWTWNGGWVYYGVSCQKSGTNNFTTDCSVNGSAPQQCKAATHCGNTEGSVRMWRCTINNQTFTSYNDPVFTNGTAFNGTYTTDVCPKNNASPSFDCASNNSDPAKKTASLCGAPNNNYGCKGGGDWCGGSDRYWYNTHTLSKTISKTDPGCGFNKGYVKGTTSPDTCGSSDTCWNTNGFRLYMVQSNVQGSCRTFPVDGNCTHLYQSQISKGGTSIYANGGPVSLVIADPNLAAGTDISALQTQYNNNQTQIDSYNQTNSTILTSMQNMQYIINAFAGVDCSQVSSLQQTSSSYSSLTSTYNNQLSTNFGKLGADLSNVYNQCTSFSTQVLPTSTSTSGNWNSTITSLNSYILTAKGDASNINTNSLTSDVTTTSGQVYYLSDIQNFPSSVISYLSSMQTNNSRFNPYSLPYLRNLISTSLKTNTYSYNIQTYLNNIITTINSIQTYLNNANWDFTNYTSDSFNKQISSLYSEQDETVTYPSWYNNLNNNVMPLINTLNSQMSYLTDNSVSSLKSSINTVYSSLNNITATLINNTKTYYDNINQINTLYATNNNLQTQINSASSSTSGTTGGYTVYMRANPVIGSNGEYVDVILAQGDPNEAGASTNSKSSLYNPFANASTTTFALSNTKCDISSAGGCSTIAQNSGVLWFYVNDPDGVYENNTGSYSITITQHKKTNGFGKIFNDIYNGVSAIVTTVANKFLANLICNNEAQTFTCWDLLRSIHIILVMYVAIFGMMFLAGLIKTDYVDFLIRIVKVAVVIEIFSPNFLYFLNSFLFDGFRNLSTFLIAMASGQNTANPFAFLSQSVGALLLDGVTYIKLISLWFKGMIGIISFVILFMAIINFVGAFFKAFEILVMSLMGVGLCFILSPFFITAFLFDKTKHLFQAWFKMLIKLTIEPAILFIGMIIINSMIVSLIQEIFNFSACFKCAVPFGFYLPGIFDGYGATSLFCFPWFMPAGTDNFGGGASFGSFTAIPLIISFYMMCKIFKVYCSDLSKQISDGILGAGIGFQRSGGGTMDGESPFKGQINNFKNFAGLRDKDMTRRAQSRASNLVDSLFDKGKASESGASAEIKPKPMPKVKTLGSKLSDVHEQIVGKGANIQKMRGSSSKLDDFASQSFKWAKEAKEWDAKFKNKSASPNSEEFKNWVNSYAKWRDDYQELARQDSIKDKVDTDKKSLKLKQDEKDIKVTKDSFLANDKVRGGISEEKFDQAVKDMQNDPLQTNKLYNLSNEQLRNALIKRKILSDQNTFSSEDPLIKEAVEKQKLNAQEQKQAQQELIKQGKETDKNLRQEFAKDKQENITKVNEKFTKQKLDYDEKFAAAMKQEIDRRKAVDKDFAAQSEELQNAEVRDQVERRFLADKITKGGFGAELKQALSKQKDKIGEKQSSDSALKSGQKKREGVKPMVDDVVNSNIERAPNVSELEAKAILGLPEQNKISANDVKRMKPMLESRLQSFDTLSAKGQQETRNLLDTIKKDNKEFINSLDQTQLANVYAKTQDEGIYRPTVKERVAGMNAPTSDLSNQLKRSQGKVDLGLPEQNKISANDVKRMKPMLESRLQSFDTLSAEGQQETRNLLDTIKRDNKEFINSLDQTQLANVYAKTQDEGIYRPTVKERVAGMNAPTSDLSNQLKRRQGKVDLGLPEQNKISANDVKRMKPMLESRLQSFDTLSAEGQQETRNLLDTIKRDNKEFINSLDQTQLDNVYAKTRDEGMGREGVSNRVDALEKEFPNAKPVFPQEANPRNVEVEREVPKAEFGTNIFNNEQNLEQIQQERRRNFDDARDILENKTINRTNPYEDNNTNSEVISRNVNPIKQNIQPTQPKKVTLESEELNVDGYQLSLEEAMKKKQAEFAKGKAKYVKRSGPSNTERTSVDDVMSDESAIETLKHIKDKRKEFRNLREEEKSQILETLALVAEQKPDLALEFINENRNIYSALMPKDVTIEGSIAGIARRIEIALQRAKNNLLKSRNYKDQLKESFELIEKRRKQQNPDENS
jgi:type IV secretory pathway VirB6-like protein